MIIDNIVIIVLIFLPASTFKLVLRGRKGHTLYQSLTRKHRIRTSAELILLSTEQLRESSHYV
jgi:hypothetical protein